MALSSLLITSIKKANLGKILSIKLDHQPISLELYYFSEDSSLLYASLSPREGIRFCFSVEELEPQTLFCSWYSNTLWC